MNLTFINFTLLPLSKKFSFLNTCNNFMNALFSILLIFFHPMGCQASSNQIAEQPHTIRQTPSAILIPPNYPKEQERRFSPQHILVGGGSLYPTKKQLKSATSSKRIIQRKSSSLLKSIHNIQILPIADKQITLDNAIQTSNRPSENSTNPSRLATFQNEPPCRKIKKNKRKKRQLQPLEKQLKKLYGL